VGGGSGWGAVFQDDEPKVLWEIIVEGNQVRLGPLEVIGKRLHEIVEFLEFRTQRRCGASRAMTRRRRRRRVCKPSPRPPAATLSRWERGFRMRSCSMEERCGFRRWGWPADAAGRVDTVRLRKPEDAPNQGSAR